MTQMEQAKNGKVTEEMRYVGAVEGMDSEELRRRIAAGRCIIPKNVDHDFNPIGVGQGLSTKVNANIGTSGHHQKTHEEVEKLRVAVQYGAEMIMDLSTGSELDYVRGEIPRRCPVILGTVPIDVQAMGTRRTALSQPPMAFCTGSQVKFVHTADREQPGPLTNDRY